MEIITIFIIVNGILSKDEFYINILFNLLSFFPIILGACFSFTPTRMKKESQIIKKEKR